MKSFLNKWKHKNHGSSFVVVVVSLTFIGIIALALLSVTLMNYKRMALSKKNDSTYYAVEKTADQLKTGLVDEANNALQEAYLKLEPEMKYFDTTDGVYKFLSDDEANKRLKKYFITNLYTNLGGADQNAQYAKLCTYIAGDSQANLVEPSIAADLLGDSYGFGITQIMDDTNQIYRIEVKGLLFESDPLDNDGYVQNLYTDFTIDAPNMEIKFNSTEASTDSFLNYILIAEDGFEIQGEGTNKFNTNISGNIYAGVDWDKNQVTFNTAYGNKYDYDAVSSINSGIYASNTVLVISSDDLVTAGNIVADNSASIRILPRTSTSGLNEIWCRNIITMNSDEKKQGASLDITGAMNVYDDLELNAKRSVVRLIGTYCGYNYGTFGGDISYDTNTYEGHMLEVYKDLKSTYGKHYNTSSILINGSNSNLDMLDLTQLTVQGKTHIDMGEDSYVTGESISTKGNQLAYSVPNELLTNVGGYVGISEEKLRELGDAGQSIQRLLTSNINVTNFVVFPVTEFSYDTKSGRYFYAFKDDEIAMDLPWDGSPNPVKLTAEQKAEAYINWYVSGAEGYTDNTAFSTYDVATGTYGSGEKKQAAFKVGSIKVSDNGEYGKVLSSGAITVKEDSSASGENAILSVGVGVADTSIPMTQAQKIRDYSFQLHYLRSTQPGDDPAMAATTDSPINVYLDVIKDTTQPVSSREFTDAAQYLLNFCGGNMKSEKDTTDPSITLYSLWIKKGGNIVVDKDFKGFIFTTEDVIIKPGCGRIEGMICAGGKVYVEDRNTELYLSAEASVMQSLIFNGFEKNSTTTENLKKLFRVDPSEEGDSNVAVGTVDEDKNMRNYNCADDIVTKNYQKNVEYISTP